MKNRVIYYKDENDDFAGTKAVGGDYEYIKDGPIKSLFYYLIAKPIAYIYSKLVYRQKTVGGKKLKTIRNSGVYIYGNHTQAAGDPFIPNCVLFPRRVYFVSHPDSVSVPVIGKATSALGALPLPGDIRSYRSFLAAIDKRIEERGAVVVFPEAHIWPYYTKIRNFPDTSFGYPCRHGTPVFCLTNTYKKSRIFRRPRIITYIDGPFYPDCSLPVKARTKALRDAVYDTMCARAEKSDCEYIKYIKKAE